MQVVSRESTNSGSNKAVLAILIVRIFSAETAVSSLVIALTEKLKFPGPEELPMNNHLNLILLY